MLVFCQCALFLSFKNLKMAIEKKTAIKTGKIWKVSIKWQEKKNKNQHENKTANENDKNKTWNWDIF